MPNPLIPHEHIADLMEHCAQVVAQTRDTVCKTRQIIRQCKEERKRYDRHDEGGHCLLPLGGKDVDRL